jgi:hypothetical protein
MFIQIGWVDLAPGSEAWDWTRCVYAYLHPKDEQILYLGKADGSTVRERFAASDKRSMFRFLEEKWDLRRVAVIAGVIALEGGRRLSQELLADIENLLIRRVRPPANVARSRISRPGLVLECVGAWPHRHARFVDR